ncbi:hypothetical protein [Streptomyces chromofuscus]|uniref:hypothetical protein n=1 Tax=Streptomyces chromofuscus TaxID=42881 RepID=UPI00167AFC35|nr:hypothetical protein [Streptomyces chromofuscus]GGT39000.1 hypothetical protein GCM10010254_68780 [Streptomyces chromofuscus]
MSNQPYEGGPYEGPYDGGYDPYQQGQPRYQQGQPQYQQQPEHQQPQYQQGLAQQQYPQHQQGQSQYQQTPQHQQGQSQYQQTPQHQQGQSQYQQAMSPYPQGQPQYQQGRHHPQGRLEQPPAAEHTQRWDGRTWDTQAQPVPPRVPQPAPESGQWAQQPYQQPQPAPEAPEAPAGSEKPLTAAQRARLEGRSPIIEPGLQPAALTAVLGLLLAGGAALASYALLVPLVLLQAVTAAGWFRLNGMWPARQGIALAFAGGVTADVALLVAGREQAPSAILGTLGVWVLLTLVLQLRSHADPDTRMYGLMATVVSAALAIVATGHLAAEPDAVTVGAVAVAAAVLARALPLPTPASVVVALLAAAGAGIAVGGATGVGNAGALLGAAAGACALIGHRVASYDYPSRFVHFTAGVALPLSAAAPVLWVLGRALV